MGDAAIEWHLPACGLGQGRGWGGVAVGRAKNTLSQHLFQQKIVLIESPKCYLGITLPLRQPADVFFDRSTLPKNISFNPRFHYFFGLGTFCLPAKGLFGSLWV
jgi:hypothetical protein